MRGRPKIAVIQELLFYESAWIGVFLGMRDGSPETEEDIPGGRGFMFFGKYSGRDRETLRVLRPDKEPVKISAHKNLAKDRMWRDRVHREEKEFEELETGQRSAKVRNRAIPAERPLWEALKRASSAAEVRRICRHSEHWLKWEWSGEINGKRWYKRAPSACPKALYDHAEEFCQAKQDKRYPRSNRPSSDDKRIEYFARVMAGLSLMKPIAPATAVDLLRKANK